ncbi:hypothetical protein NP493_1273g01022 [Ridgeia piscesae]|uniref:Mucin-like protein n=1 Tax=Ridgeia piscesae TaxID=27915 RepID=A0AAD9KAF1_RIDPI|nr:hypothetical protein NP493_1273g01022 [Ridgeia piscesae]
MLNLGKTGLGCDWVGKSCHSGFIKTPRMKIFSSEFTNIKIYSNGYVTLGQSYNRRMPADFVTVSYSKKWSAYYRGFALFAPLWTDANFQRGRVTYHIYDRTDTKVSETEKYRVKHALQLAKEDTENYGGSSSINPSWVMVISWVDNTPRMYYSDFYEQPNTFQMVLIFDPARWITSVMFLYEKTGWDRYWMVRDSQIGFYVTRKYKEDSRALAQSGKSSAFEMAEIVGNTGKMGKFYFSVSAGDSSINYDLKCRNWFWQQQSYWWYVVLGWMYTRVCPCDQRRVVSDRRWKFDVKEYFSSNGERVCYYERRPYWISTQQCCYEYGSLIGRRDGTGGQTFFLHPHYGQSHINADVKPKDWCCDKSDNCDIFYEARPLDTCWGYVPPFLAWFFGDPHIHTLDNFEYTFNGLGEYSLIETTGGNFTLQGRTAKATNDKGTETNATIFSAFAAKDVDSDRVYVAMNDKSDALVIFVEEDEQTSWFANAKLEAEVDFENVSLIKDADSTVSASFKSGFTITVALNESQLSITVAAPDNFLNDTKGLLGVFNKDPSDDLTPADGSAPLATNATEKTIFYKFGETWRINMTSSLFYYPQSTDYNTFNIINFTPLFYEEVVGKMTPEEKAEAKKTCGENKECIFDLAVTGNAKAAASGLETTTKNKETADMLGDSCDEDFDGCGDGPCTAGTNCTDLTPAEEAAQDKAFNCSACPEGYEDNDGVCVDVNECDKDKPLHDCGQLCVNKVPGFVSPGPRFLCDCNKGYRLNADEKNCTDVDECVEKSSGCEHICTNDIGNFTCSCYTGYELKSDNKTCTQTDVDECASSDTHACQHNCVNIDGGYNCSCNDGYVLNADERKCKRCPDGKWVHSVPPVNCFSVVLMASGARNVPFVQLFQCCPDGKWGPQCSRLCNCETPTTACNASTGCTKCPPGFTGGDCYEDLNECDQNPCGANADCTNSVGTFRCDCHAGYVQHNLTACVELDECESTPCENDGTCVDKFNNYTCTCAPGYTGRNCTVDVDECGSTPCENGGSCVNLVNKYRCKCPNGFAGRTCQTGLLCNCPVLLQGCRGCCVTMPHVVSALLCNSAPCQNGGVCNEFTASYNCTCSSSFNGTFCQDLTKFAKSLRSGAQVMISVKLTKETFTTKLEDKTSLEYKNMKAKVIKALSDILVKTLPDKFLIVDVTFRKGSVVVDYRVAVPEDIANPGNTIVNAIKEESGGWKFGEFEVDVNSIKAENITFNSYHAQFKIISIEYTEELADKASAKHKKLETDVTTELDKVYQAAFPSTFVDITNIDFSKGSVVTDFDVRLADSNTNTAKSVQVVLDEYFAKNGGQLGTYSVFMPKESSSSKTGIIVGGIVGGVVVVVIIVVLVYIFVIKKNKVDPDT